MSGPSNRTVVWPDTVSVTNRVVIGSEAAPITADFTFGAVNRGPSGAILLVSTAGGPIRATLPAAVRGLQYTVKDVGYALSTNPFTLVPAGAVKIEKLAQDYDYMADGGALTVFCDGTDWWLL